MRIILLSDLMIIQFIFLIPNHTLKRNASSLLGIVLSSLLLIGLKTQVISDQSVEPTNSCSSILNPKREIHQVPQTQFQPSGLIKHANSAGASKESSHQDVTDHISTLLP